MKGALKSPHVLVRFCAAESLAYLGSPACGDELARLAVQYEALRGYCLTALASLDEPICHVKLAELLASTERTIEATAREVGYHNPFVFSNAFTKWIGWRPSEYRRKRLKAPVSESKAVPVWNRG